MTLKLILVLGMLLCVAACVSSPFGQSQARFYPGDSESFAHESNSGGECGADSPCP